MFLLVMFQMSLLVRQVETQSEPLSAQADALDELARRDALTGLPNRHALAERVDAELRRADRDGTALSVAILDIDHFKRYNDTRGHQAGDQLLRDASTAWSAHLRDGDFLARYGGEEFVLLTLATATATAVVAVERLLPITPDNCAFSAGVAHWTGLETFESLISRADQALDRAKETDDTPAADEHVTALGAPATRTAGSSFSCVAGGCRSRGHGRQERA